MLESILIGSGFALAAGITPGPQQAFLLSSVAQKGWKRTLPAAFSPLISDGPIALLVLLVLNHIPPVVGLGLQIAGGAFLLYLAWASYRQWRKQAAPGSEAGETKGSVPRTLLQAVIVNLLNPSVYLGWSLVLGPAFSSAWQQRPADGVALLVAFYATMVTVLAGTVLLFGTTHLLGTKSRRALILVSGIVLAALGVYQLIVGVLTVVSVTR